MFATTKIIFLAASISLSLSSLDCRYFQAPSGGPMIPINICLSAKFGDFTWGSYQYTCSGSEVTLEWYDQSTDCDSDFYPLDLGSNLNVNCPITAGTCDYLSFRAYQQRTDLCEAPKPDDNYFDAALVRGCWNSWAFNGHSANLDCSSDTTATLSTYNVLNCDASPKHTVNIHSGCNTNITLPIIQEIEEMLNITIPRNKRYFELLDCGEGYSWLWLWILAPILFVLCCGGCIVFWCWWARCRKHKKTQFLVNDELPNQANEV